MKNSSSQYNPTNNAGLGIELGILRSTSEGLQGTILVVCLGIGLALSFLVIPGVPLILVLAGSVGGAFLLAHLASQTGRFSTSFRVFEHGMEFCKKGKLNRFAYDDVEQLGIRHSHHSSTVGGHQVYVGTRVKFELQLEGRFKVLQYDLEYNRRKPSAKPVAIAAEKLCEAVELRLSRQIEGEGSIPLSPDVSLTMDGLRVASTGKTIPFEEIETWKQSGDCVQLLKHNEALPFAALPLNSKNFIPAFSLFSKMCTSVSGIPIGDELVVEAA